MLVKYVDFNEGDNGLIATAFLIGNKWNLLVREDLKYSRESKEKKIQR